MAARLPIPNDGDWWKPTFDFWPPFMDTANLVFVLIVLLILNEILFVGTVPLDPEFRAMVLVGVVSLVALPVLVRRFARGTQFRLTPDGLFVKRFWRGERMAIAWESLKTFAYRENRWYFLLIDDRGRTHKIPVGWYGDPIALRDALMRFVPTGIRPPELPQAMLDAVAQLQKETDPFDNDSGEP